MRILGWFCFCLGISITILAVMVASVAPNSWFNMGRAFGFAIVFMLPLIILGWGLAHLKPKHLVCPNGCNITQSGTKFCGQCGSRLVRR